jgi:hypothetical protein
MTCTIGVVIDPNYKFTAVFLRMNTGSSVIKSLRRVACIGMLHAPKFLDEEHKAIVRWLASTGVLQRMIVSADGSGLPGDRLEEYAALMIGQLTDMVLMNTSYSVDAASVVFGHTVLEDALNSFLEITTEVSPEFWLGRVEKKTIELRMLKDESIDVLKKKAAQTFTSTSPASPNRYCR